LLKSKTPLLLVECVLGGAREERDPVVVLVVGEVGADLGGVVGEFKATRGKGLADGVAGDGLGHVEVAEGDDVAGEAEVTSGGNPRFR
jgi:hypothetical protein